MHVIVMVVIETVGDIVNGAMVAMWPTDDMGNSDGNKGFWLGNVVECNLVADTVTVVHWEVSDNDEVYLCGHPNNDVVTVEFNLILLHGFVLLRNGVMRQSTVNVINNILSDDV